MTVEAAGFIDDIDPTQPLGTDAKSEGDDHLRNFKKSVQDSFPNISEAMTVTASDLNGFFTTGNLMLFQQTTAPTGWTKETTHNDKALRVVSGTVSSGGSSSFTTAFGSGKTTDAHTLTVSQMPSHTHTLSTYTSWAGSTEGRVSEAASGSSSSETTGSAGSGGSHTHNLSNFDLQYVDLIIAGKD